MRRKDVVIAKHSCITDRIVWTYFGSSEEGARKAYWRACKKEVRRIRQWKNRMEERRRRLMHILAICGGSSSSSSCMRNLTARQRKAARKIIALCNNQPVQDRAFYNHIIEEARQRNWRSGRWKENRVKMFRYGKTHVASEYKKKGSSR